MGGAGAATARFPWQQAGGLLQVLEQISHSVNTDQDSIRVLESIVAAVTQHGPWSICWAGVFDLQNDRLRIHADSGFSGATPQPEEQWTVLDSPSWQATQQGGPFVIDDALHAAQFPLVQEDARLRGFRSVLIIPLHMDGDAGVIWFCTPQLHAFSDEEVAFATIVASITSIALSNARYQAAQQKLLNTERIQSTQLAQLKDVAEARYRELQELLATRERLLNALIDERGLDGMVEEVSGIVERPVAVFDRFGNRISSTPSASALRPGAAGAWPTLDELLGDRPRLHSYIRASRVSIRDREFAVARITSGDDSLGYLCVEDTHGEVTGIDLAAVDEASIYIALEFAKDRIRFEAFARLFGDFTAALLSGQRLESCAVAIGVDLARPLRVYRVVLSETASAATGDPLLFSRHLHRRLKMVWPHNVALPAGERELLFIIPDDSAETHSGAAFAAAVREAVAASLASARVSRPTSAAHLTIGIGGRGTGAEGLMRSDEQARRVLAVADTAGLAGRDLDTAALGSYTLISALPTAETGEFSRRYLGALTDYDREHDAELIRTLAVFLDSTGPNEASERLHIHLSTLKYRLKRIEEISGVQLNDSEGRLCLQLALRIEKITVPPATRTPARRPRRRETRTEN